MLCLCIGTQHGGMVGLRQRRQLLPGLIQLTLYLGLAGQLAVQLAQSGALGKEGPLCLVESLPQRLDVGGLVDDRQQGLPPTAGQRRNLPLGKNAQWEACRIHALAGRRLPLVVAPFFHRRALAIGSPQQAKPHVLVQPLHTDNSIGTQRALVVTTTDNLAEGVEMRTRFVALAQRRQFLVAPRRQPQGMHNGGLPRSTPADNRIEERRARQSCRLAIAHVTRILNFDGSDDMSGYPERVECAFITAPDRHTIAVQQGQTKPFERRAGHLDPGVTAAGNSRSLEAVAVAAQYPRKARSGLGDAVRPRTGVIAPLHSL
ncbi:hypothetical protein D9M68_601800 [compost metagenome]